MRRIAVLVEYGKSVRLLWFEHYLYILVSLSFHLVYCKYDF